MLYLYHRLKHVTTLGEDSIITTTSDKVAIYLEELESSAFYVIPLEVVYSWSISS